MNKDSDFNVLSSPSKTTLTLLALLEYDSLCLINSNKTNKTCKFLFCFFLTCVFVFYAIFYFFLNSLLLIFFVFFFKKNLNFFLSGDSISFYWFLLVMITNQPIIPSFFKKCSLFLQLIFLKYIYACRRHMI